MAAWPDGCVDHCIADPPFGIASGSGRRGKKGLGWAFSSHVTMQETWDRFSHDDFFQFNVRWLSEVCRVVKPNGNILVFGTFHNIYQLGFILQSVLNRRILNSIVWFKPNAQPNITARTLTESTEQIIWAVNETPRAREEVDVQLLGREGAGRRPADAQPVGVRRHAEERARERAITRRRSRWRWSNDSSSSRRSPMTCCSTPSAAPAPSPSLPGSTGDAGC